MRDDTGSFIWYELMTTDIDAAARFYGAVVGWKIGAGPGAGESGINDYRMIQRDDGGNAGGALQLTTEMRAGGANPVWLAYLYVPDVPAATRAIEDDGGQTLMRRSLPVGDIAMVTDPAGTPFYVMRPVPPPGQPQAKSDVFDSESLQRVQWNELSSPDLVRAKAFYAKHFGFEFKDTMSMREHGDYCFFEHGGERCGALMQRPKDSPLNGWLFYFGVPSVMAAKRAIETGGGRIVMPVHQVPGGDWIVVAADPQGAHFGITGPKGE